MRTDRRAAHEALDIYRKYAVLHMSLFPYRYAAAQEAAKTGMPLMRALVLNYQDDPRARTAKDEYLFGAGLPGRAGDRRGHAAAGLSARGRVGGLLDGQAPSRAARWSWRMRRWM